MTALGRCMWLTLATIVSKSSQLKGGCLGSVVRIGGELKYPGDVAVDSNNMVFVSGDDNKCVSVFTSEGQFVTTVGGFGKPSGISVSSGVV